MLIPFQLNVTFIIATYQGFFRNKKKKCGATYARSAPFIGGYEGILSHNFDFILGALKCTQIGKLSAVSYKNRRGHESSTEGIGKE